MSAHCSTPNLTSSLDVYDCEFSQTMVTQSKLHPPEYWTTRTEQLRRDMVKFFGKPDWRRSCKTDENFFARQQERFAKNEHVLELLAENVAEHRAACACTDAACAADAMLAEERRRDGKTCNIMSTKFEASFKRDAQYRWISVHGPEGLCGNVLTQILEYDPKEDAWSFVQKRVVTQEGPLCAGGESTSRLYSHSNYVGTDAKMDCQFIDTIIP